MTPNMRKTVPWSKILTASIVLLVYGFIAWACAEMHRLGDLSPLSYIGTAVIGLLATVVAAYMWRAKQTDLFLLDLKKSEEMARLRRAYGQDLRSERVQQPGDGGYASGYSGYSGHVGYSTSSDDDPVG